MKISHPLANKIGASAEIIFTSSSDFITFCNVSQLTQETDLDSGEWELVDFKVVVFVFNFVDDMLPICCQNIAVLSLETLRYVLKGRVELSGCRDISALSDLTCCTEMTSTVCRIVREWRRCSHLLRSSLLWRTWVLIWIHFVFT